MPQALEPHRRWIPKPVRTVAWKSWRWLKRGKPGLVMRYSLTEPPPEFPPPPGYHFRPWRDGDRSPWIDLLNASGTLGEWNEARFQSELRGMVWEAHFVAEHDGALVAAAGVLERPLNNEPAFEIAWVVRHPDHSGYQLGRGVVVRALETALALPGERPVFLNTEDERLTAIALYLDLGFVPDMSSHGSYPRRWEAVRKAIAGRHEPRASVHSAPNPNDGSPAPRARD